jgi:hypothetical protein
MFHRTSLLVTLPAVAGAFALSSCSGGGSLPNASAPPLQSTSILPSVQRDAGATALYVSDWYGKSVFRYVRNADGTLQSPAASSLVLSYNPGPIAIGTGGGLFVTDQDAESLLV